jgi:hypothetical protein
VSILRSLVCRFSSTNPHSVVDFTVLEKDGAICGKESSLIPKNGALAEDIFMKEK